MIIKKNKSWIETTKFNFLYMVAGFSLKGRVMSSGGPLSRATAPLHQQESVEVGQSSDMPPEHIFFEVFHAGPT